MNIQFGFLGNGITVYTPDLEINRDYPIVAHISPYREISWYATRILPDRIHNWPEYVSFYRNIPTRVIDEIINFAITNDCEHFYTKPFQMPKEIQKRLKVLNHNEISHIELELFYAKESYDSSYKLRPRGYRMHAIPVHIKEEVLDGRTYEIKSWVSFTGFSDGILEVSRKTNKNLEEATKIFNSRLKEYIDAVIAKHNLEVDKEEYETLIKV